MQRPKQRHRHEQQHEVDDYVTETKDVFHIVRLRFAHRRRCNAQFVTERSGQRLAREADQEHGNGCPNGHKGTDCPRRVAEFRADFENAVEED